jgi:hypothetical protein
MEQALRPDDIAIGQLRIRGPAGQQQRLQQEIALSSWPRAHGESWVFIRQLNVKAPAQRLSRELTQLTRDKLDKAKSPGAHSDAIRFNNFTELLAYLLSDLAHGRAAHCWYWQRWSTLFPLAPSAALRHLLSEYLTDLPAISSQLHQLKMLEDVWLRMSDADTEQLLTEFSWKLGIRLTKLRDELPADEITTVPEISTRLLQPLFARWQSLFKQLEHESPHYCLALLIIALEAAPLALHHAPSALVRYLDRRQRAFSMPAAHDDSQPLIERARLKTDAEKSSHAATPGDEQTAHIESENHSVDSVPDTNKLMPDKQNDLSIQVSSAQQSLDEQAQQETGEQTPLPTPASISPEVISSGQDVVTKAIDVEPTLHHDVRESVAAEDHAAKATPPSSETEQTVIHTQQGGLFYCLNFLNRPECQTILAEHWQELPDGWGWLYRLGQTLQLDQDDPVLDFLCLQTGFDTRQALEQLAPLPAADELNALAQRWYAKTEVWSSELLRLDATIKFSPSHVDIHTTINNVQLPVRLAGLDINPGWLPWLGKVVSFHYDI